MPSGYAGSSRLEAKLAEEAIHMIRMAGKEGVGLNPRQYTLPAGG
jgi:hypothetical protein